MIEASVSMLDLLKGAVRRAPWIIFVGGVAAAATYLWATKQAPLYRADAHFAYVVPPESGGSQVSGALSGVASIFGGGRQESQRPIAVATLRSRKLLAAFAERYDLKTLVFAEKWDPQRKQWMVPDSEVPTWLDVGDALRAKHVDVTEEADTGLLTLLLSLPDRERVAPLTNELLRVADVDLRAQAASESGRRLTVLRRELAQATNSMLQASIAQLVATELQKQTLAESGSQYAFRVIDPAVEPSSPFWPRPRLLAALALVLGVFAGVLVSVVVDVVRHDRRRE